MSDQIYPEAPMEAIFDEDAVRWMREDQRNTPSPWHMRREDCGSDAVWLESQRMRKEDGGRMRRMIQEMEEAAVRNYEILAMLEAQPRGH